MKDRLLRQLDKDQHHMCEVTRQQQKGFFADQVIRKSLNPFRLPRINHNRRYKPPSKTNKNEIPGLTTELTSTNLRAHNLRMKQEEHVERTLSSTIELQNSSSENPALTSLPLIEDDDIINTLQKNNIEPNQSLVTAGLSNSEVLSEHIIEYNDHINNDVLTNVDRQNDVDNHTEDNKEDTTNNSNGYDEEDASNIIGNTEEDSYTADENKASKRIETRHERENFTTAHANNQKQINNKNAKSDAIEQESTNLEPGDGIQDQSASETENQNKCFLGVTELGEFDDDAQPDEDVFETESESEEIQKKEHSIYRGDELPTLTIPYRQYKQKLKDDIVHLPSITEDENYRPPSVKALKELTVLEPLSVKDIQQLIKTPTKNVPSAVIEKSTIYRSLEPLSRSSQVHVTSQNISEKDVPLIGRKHTYAASCKDERLKMKPKQVYSKSVISKSYLSDISSNTHINKGFFDDLTFSLPHHLAQKVSERRSKLVPTSMTEVKRKELLKESRVISSKNVLDNPKWHILTERIQQMEHGNEWVFLNS